MKHKRLTSALAALAVMISSVGITPAPKSEAAGNLLAFPGAVGGGKYATGGRGGEVYHVTNLNDSGAGSFRDAVSKSGRIVVFDVSGTIELKSNILCQSNVTVAGQTAPGGSGITLKNYKMGMSGDNIICRYISSRPGPYASTSSGNDAWGGAKGSNSIIDHCSMSWTTDEQWGLYSNNEYYTVQYSIIGPADSWGGHSKGVHGFGLMMGKGYSTFDHNLIIHNVSRNFRGKVEGKETADFTNNVIYNWAYQTAYGTIGHLNYVNNTLKMGNGTTGGYHYVAVDSSTKPENFGIYLSGNRMLNKDDSVYGDITYDNWNGITVKDGLGITKDSVKSSSAFQTIVNGENVSTALTAESAEDSYDHVLSFAGNGISPELRTAVDLQCAEEAMNGTGYHSGTASYDSANDSEKANIDKYKIQCGVTYEYPSAVLTKTITDNDNDGMDDFWELERGLDPNDPNDYKGDYCGQGYMNIEYYINDLTINSFPEGVVTLSPTEGIAPLPTVSAFETIEAENFDDQSGVKTEDCSEGGQNVGYIENGDYIMFRRVDFEDGAKSFTARIAGNAANIEIYLDSMNGTPVNVCKYFEGTSGFQDWQDFTWNIGLITGVHDLYLKFTGGDGYLLNINNFVFGREFHVLSGRLIKELSLAENAYPQAWKIADNAADGSLLFGDRDVVFVGLPGELKGAEQLLTACDAKALSADETVASFKAGEDIDVYIVLDNRVEIVPSWMSGYEKTALTVDNDNNVTFDIYKKSVKSGDTVELGGNGQSYNCVNYTVLAVASGEELVGDVNNDGEVGVADLVTLSMHLLNEEPLKSVRGADVNGDGFVDVFDMVTLRQILAKRR